MVDQQGMRLPYFTEVKIIVTGNPVAESVLFRNGKSDAYEIVRPAEFEQFTKDSKNGRFKLLDLGTGAERDFLWFNQNTGTNRDGTPIVNPAKLKWFRNRKFRQAVSCGIDRERMVREVYGGRARAAYSFLSTENPKWNNAKVPQYSFDPAKAKALLAEIGIEDRHGSGVAQDDKGNAIEILFVSNVGNPAREKAAAMIQEDLRKIGIKLIYTPVPFEVLRNKVDRAFDYECALMGLGGGGLDPATQINVLRSSEDLHQWFPFQSSPSTDWEARIDALMDAQMRSLDFAARKKAFDEVQMILTEELPMIYTVSPFCYAAIRPTVGNLRPSSLTPYRLTWNIDELYFNSK
jgi:peptide/nickel transport system substrate-binding protein